MILIGGNLRNLIDNFSNEKLCKSENVGEIEIILNWKKKSRKWKGRSWKEIWWGALAWKRELTLVGPKTIKIIISEKCPCGVL